MRQISLIALVSVLALFTSGCTIGQDEDQAAQESPSPQPAASVSPPKPSPAATSTPFGSKPLVAQQPGTSSAVPGLIQPELPENAVKRVPLGKKSDPFSAVPVQPQVTVSPNQSANQGASQGANNRPVPTVPQLPAPQLPKIPLAPQTKNNGPQKNNGSQAQRKGVIAAQPLPNLLKLPPPPTAKGSNSSPSGSGSQPGQTAKLAPPGAAPKIVPELPKLPEPTQAQGVQVTGVVEVGGVQMAIVKVPNEPDRYVREGQRIANGQVLVKRIETNRGPNPVVILEQYGVEVARGVGETPSTSPGGPGQPPPPPTASVPPASTPSHTTVSSPA